MTAWQLLIAHSALDAGTAWEHLNAQVGGQGGTTVVDISDIDIGCSSTIALIESVDLVLVAVANQNSVQLVSQQQPISCDITPNMVTINV